MKAIFIPHTRVIKETGLFLVDCFDVFARVMNASADTMDLKNHNADNIDQLSLYFYYSRENTNNKEIYNRYVR